MLELFIGLDM